MGLEQMARGTWMSMTALVRIVRSCIDASRVRIAEWRGHVREERSAACGSHVTSIAGLPECREQCSPQTSHETRGRWTVV